MYRVGHLILRALAIRASNLQNALARKSFHSPKSLSQEITIEALTLYFTQFFIDESWWAPCSLRQNVSVLPAWTPCLPDHRGLDSDQQYHFAKVHGLCNYHKAEAIIVFYFAKPNVALQRPFLDYGKFVFRDFSAKQSIKNIIYFAV